MQTEKVTVVLSSKDIFLCFKDGKSRYTGSNFVQS